MGIASILVEGGAKTFSGFINANIADEAYIFIAPKIFGRGLDVVSLPGKTNVSIKDFSWMKSGEDMLVNFKLASQSRPVLQRDKLQRGS